MIWKMKKKELTDYFMNFNLLFSRIQSILMKCKMRTLYQILIVSKFKKYSKLDLIMLPSKDVIEEVADEFESSEIKEKKPLKD